MPRLEPKGPCCHGAYSPMGPLEGTACHINNHLVTATTYISETAWQVPRRCTIGPWVLGVRDIWDEN